MPTRVEQVKPLFVRPDWFLQKKRYNIRLRAEIIQQFLNGEQFDSVLDVGCGDGSLSLPHLRPQNRLTLVDISEDMLAAARAQIPAELAGNVKILNNDFMGAELEPHGYDLILCVGVLAYVESPATAIARVASLLKPGGTVITENTDSSHLLSLLYARARRVLGPDCSLNAVPTRAVLDLYHKQGFELSAMYRYSLALPGLGSILSQPQLYRLVRALHGTLGSNRNKWLGNECLYCFRHVP
ncbi:MAG: class I SAM-dependent methyltransferase [Terriglobales bacterium]